MKKIQKILKIKQIKKLKKCNLKKFLKMPKTFLGIFSSPPFQAELEKTPQKPYENWQLPDDIFYQIFTS